MKHEAYQQHYGNHVKATNYEALAHRLRELVDEYQTLVETYEADLVATRAENARLQSLLSDEIKALAVMAKDRGRRIRTPAAPVIAPPKPEKPEPIALVPPPAKKHRRKNSGPFPEPVTRICRCGQEFSTVRRNKTLCDPCAHAHYVTRGAELHRKLALAKRMEEAS